MEYIPLTLTVLPSTKTPLTTLIRTLSPLSFVSSFEEDFVECPVYQTVEKSRHLNNYTVQLTIKISGNLRIHFLRNIFYNLHVKPIDISQFSVTYSLPHLPTYPLFSLPTYLLSRLLTATSLPIRCLTNPFVTSLTTPYYLLPDLPTYPLPPYLYTTSPTYPLPHLPIRYLTYLPVNYLTYLPIHCLVFLPDVSSVYPIPLC